MIRFMPPREKTISKLLFIDRQFHHFGLQLFVPNANENFRIGFAKLSTDVAHSNANLHHGRHGSRGYFANKVSLAIEYFVMLTGNTSVNHLKANKFSF